jgi:hypothetical protein
VRRPGPPPPTINLRLVLLIGMGLWVIAGVVFTVVFLTRGGTWTGLAICGAGLVLGGFGLLWARGKTASHEGDREQ